ncbi:pyridoxal phosphate-dependent decarboxylase family protein [Pseudonocardia sp. TRM90224]|uniref:pyridoxal phosphate-dependent decarboxylase family protein n=1 Tax=Pseudonocardia sp. TRM90224 TaxID=2812678 RepID=UPI001E3EA4E8|nr:pyridoxal-dependent decarboxylase [Pseudonocardia sp. TRM90224]
MHSVDATTEQMIRSVLAYAENRLRLDPVPLDQGPRDAADLARATRGLLSAEGTNADQVLGVYTSMLAPTVISADSPRFLGFIPAAPTKAALLFDMLVSCASIQGISWLEAAGAVHAENEVLRLIADKAGLPDTAGGCFVSGGSAANLSALVVAREMAKKKVGADGRRWRAAVGSDAHSSIVNTLKILEMDALTVPTDDHQLTGEALRAAIDADGDPSSIAVVVATSGTTNAGIVDDLAGIAAVAREHDLWFHVDGAYGGGGLFAPSVRHKYNGIEHADSFIVDPHKWLFAPFDCAALIYRDPQKARGVHTQDASYLDVIHDRPAEWNPTDYAYHLTRRARGLPLWFSLAVHGVAAYTDAVETALQLARDTADEIRGRANLELIREPDLGVVLFRRLGWEPAQYTAWADQLLADQVAFIPPSAWEGETVARFAFLHPHTSMDLVREVLDRMDG